LGVALAALVSQSALAQTAPTLDVTPRAAPAEALAPAPQEAAPTPQGESIAAVVNDELISTYDLRQRLLLVLIQAGVQPTEAQFRQFQREALQRLIDERLQMQELRRQETERKLVGKLIASEAQVNAAMNRLAQQSNLTLPQFEAALASAGVNIQTLRERTRAELSWDRWINGRFGQYIRIGPEQVAATIQQINESSTRPSYRINEIFIDAARVGGQAEAIAGAQQLVDQILAGAAFSAVARQFSAASTAATGGDAGWLLEPEVHPQVLPTVQQMTEGQVSAPLPVTDGVYIVQLREKRAGGGATVVNLKQAAVRLAADAPEADVAAAQSKLAALKTQVTGCGDLDAKAAAVEGVIATDLGEAEVGDLDAQFRQAAEQLGPNQISDPIRTQVGLHLVAVCAKRSGSRAAPTPQQVEDRLMDQQLAMASRRYMRDLRNSATIESR